MEILPMNEITISTSSVPTNFTFKNAKLNELSAKIAEQSAAMNALYTEAKDRAEAINKALAPIFGELLKSKCYKDDGFKSVADFAEQTFGMGKSMAYMLARVGEQFYNDDNEYTKTARDTLSTSKLAEFTGVDRVAIAKAIDDGKLTKDTPLVECREFAAAHKKQGKERVLPTFTVAEMTSKAVIAENVDKEAMFEAVADALCMAAVVDSSAAVFFSTAKLDGDKASAAQHFIAYTSGGYVKMYEYRPYIKPVNKGKRPTFAELLAQLSEEERAQLAAMAAGAKGD